MIFPRSQTRNHPEREIDGFRSDRSHNLDMHGIGTQSLHPTQTQTQSRYIITTTLQHKLLHHELAIEHNYGFHRQGRVHGVSGAQIGKQHHFVAL